MDQIKHMRVEVLSRPMDGQTSGARWVTAAQQLGIPSLTGCHVARVFFILGTEYDVQKLSEKLLTDPVTESFQISSPAEIPTSEIPADHTLDVSLLPGVTDPVAENLVKTAQTLGLESITWAATGQRYFLEGNLSSTDLATLATKVFSNEVIQRYAIDQVLTPPYVEHIASDGTVEMIELRFADSERLLQISNERGLALNLDEMLAVQTYYQSEERDPTDVELEMIAQTWSEHCVHKTFRATIDYTEKVGNVESTETVNGLLNTYIRGATERLNKPWLRSVFVDNAGIIAFDDEWDLAFKAETHNHPSAIEPFGGANTGVGGVVRDVIGVSARPIANTDALCFGPQDLPLDELPTGTLHPTRIKEGVVHGIEDYGNKMGIPTVNGTVLYHEGYVGNPLVYCGCLGILPHGSNPTEVQPNDLIVVLGGHTGRDGLRGATFSSMEMSDVTGEESGSAVQIGHPINEKQVLEAILQARDAKLYNAITDCGAGGLSSAIGEMGEGIGARIQLNQVPLKYPGLRPWEIWLSEAQERMVLAVSPENWDALREICAGQDVTAVCIGEFEPTGRFLLYDGEREVGNLSSDFLHDGLPPRHMQAVWEAEPTQLFSASAESSAIKDVLLKLLAHPNIRSKEPIVRRYDHEVQGGTVVKPLVGVANHGPGDATVLTPLDSQMHAKPTQSNWPRGAAVSMGICPQYTDIDPYNMAWAAIDEALRNAVAVGADPDQIAILDNFCWGNPDLPDRLGKLVRASQGCYDAALAYGAPYISGKDSLNNEYTDKYGQRHTIPGTLLISALGIVPDTKHTTTMDLKQSGNVLYVIGETRDEVGGSHYAMVVDGHGGEMPQPVVNALDHFRTLHQAMQQDLVQACHDCSEGGLGVALAEMCLAGRLGADVEISSILGADNINNETHTLFAESLSRFVVEVQPEDVASFETILADTPFAKIGTVTNTNELVLHGQVDTTISVNDLEQAWRGSYPIAQQTAHTNSPISSVPTLTKTPKVLILHANGTNRDREAVLACELAGGSAEIVHVNQIFSGERVVLDYDMFVIPGGFSYGDDLGAGVLWSVDLQHRLTESMTEFVESGRPVLGICNGFQTLVKAGFLPGHDFSEQRAVTLTFNESREFECRWVYLEPNQQSKSVFLQGLNQPIYCPVAHGEGHLAVRDETVAQTLDSENLIALRYVTGAGEPASYPDNPNGSVLNIAGLSNPAGNVLGLMPHPEDHVFPWQHPRWHRNEAGLMGLELFKNGVKNA